MEWRERGLWFALWALSAVIIDVLGIGAGYGKGMVPVSTWVVLPMGFALLAGLMGYGSELKGERGTFLYSRALLWKSLLIAKVLPGIIVAVVSAILGGLIWWQITAPDVYLPFITAVSLLTGMGCMILFTGVAYLLGVCCSIVLPGIAGSIICGLLFIGTSMVAVSLHEEFNAKIEPFIIPICMIGAPLIALVVIARFGVTLSATQRFIRFMLIVILIIGAGLLLDQTVLSVKFSKAFASNEDENTASISLSPNGRMAFLQQYYPEGKVDTEWVNLETKQHGKLPTTSNATFSWSTIDCALIEMYEDEDDDMQLAYWPHGQLQTIKVKMSSSGSTLRTSPNGEHVMLMNRYDRIVKVANIRKGTIRTLVKFSNKDMEAMSMRGYIRPVPIAWWQDNQTVGYIVPQTGKRVLVRIE